MTNEEILSDHIGADIEECIGQDFYIESEVLQLMDEARKDEAERYGKFLLNYSPIMVKEGVVKWWDKVMGGKNYTTEQLYELFKQKEK